MLVDLNLQEIPPTNPVNGYSEAEVLNYLRSIDPLSEYVVAEAALEKEVAEVPVVVSEAEEA
jgi:hypothetical protein